MLTNRQCDFPSQASPDPQPQPTALVDHITPVTLRASQFFLEQTVPQFTKTFPDDLWGIWVPRIAETEPRLWHAFIAVPLYHELFILQSQQGLGATELRQRALVLNATKHYNAALIETTSATVVGDSRCLLMSIVSSSIFFTIEAGRRISTISIQMSNNEL